MRWINVVTNTASAPQQVGIGLRGLLGSMNQTKITATSTGDSSLTTADQWFTTAQAVAQGTTSTEPRIGYLFQGPNPALAPHSGDNQLARAGGGDVDADDPGGRVGNHPELRHRPGKQQAGEEHDDQPGVTPVEQPALPDGAAAPS